LGWANPIVRVRAGELVQQMDAVFLVNRIQSRSLQTARLKSKFVELAECFAPFGKDAAEGRIAERRIEVADRRGGN
jgi:hypothetical protein